MGTVYKAQHVTLGRDCALKTMPTHAARDKSYVERFHREARAAAAIDHPSVIEVYDVGADPNGDITTLGRGGSDTSAVAIAVAITADVCEIYTDVDGIYTADPNICEKARKIKEISYDEMLNMASLGAKVLQ